MYLFVVIVVLVYGLMHLYLYLKMRAGITLGPAVNILVIIWLVLMLVSPFLIHLTERLHLKYLPKILGYIGYTWLGFLFLFISISLVMDLYRLIVHTTGLLNHKDIPQFIIPTRYGFLVPFGLAILICIYGYFEAYYPRIHHISIRSEKILPAADKLRLVQISDVHLGLMVNRSRLTRIIKLIKEVKPDILISTGDLVDGQPYNLEGLADLLNEVKPKYGKFAVTGNHEFYAGLKNALDFHEKAGFRMLREEGITISDIINIVGVDDTQGRSFGLTRNLSDKDVLTPFTNGKFTVFLKHRPIIEEETIGLFGLQLSGHTHKGQIFPFGIITRLVYGFAGGRLNDLGGSLLYVTNGTGTWGPPIRFLAPPEITVIELTLQ